MEVDLRSDYATRCHDGDDSAWDDVKDAVQHAYNKARVAMS